MGAWFRPGFRMHPSSLSLQATTWRGNPVGIVLRDAHTIRWLPYASTGLPRRGSAPPRNDNTKKLAPIEVIVSRAVARFNP